MTVAAVPLRTPAELKAAWRDLRTAKPIRTRDAATRLPDGGLEVTVPGDSEAWLTRWILSFGGNATVLSPDWAIRAVAEAARASLQSR